MNTEQEKAIRDVIHFVRSIKPFTVGDMRKAIENLPDDMQILIGSPLDRNSDAWKTSDWWNISHTVESPYSNEDLSALTFYLSNDYDGRQF
jgi:hypothetical protein